MKILLDTHIAIWAVLDSEELSNTARAMILDENNEIYYSTASVCAGCARSSYIRGDPPVYQRPVRYETDLNPGPAQCLSRLIPEGACQHLAARQADIRHAQLYDIPGHAADLRAV